MGKSGAAGSQGGRGERKGCGGRVRGGPRRGNNGALIWGLTAAWEARAESGDGSPADIRGERKKGGGGGEGKTQMEELGP